MKRIFKITMIFFALAMSLLLEPQALQAQPVDTVGYIQNVKTETVVLVSNNILNGEISSYQEENSQNYLGSSPLVINLENNQFLYKFTKMLLEKGVRPYESLNGKSVSVFKLLTNPKLTEADINFIKSPLSSTMELDVPESAIQPIQPSIPKPCQPIKPQAEVETSEEKQVEEKQVDKVDDFKYCLVESDRIITLSDNLTFLVLELFSTTTL